MQKNRRIKYWRHDSFCSTKGSFIKYDKPEHALLGFIGMFILMLFIREKSLQIILLLFVILNMIGLLWELLQVFAQKLPVEIKDVAANNPGFILGSLPGYLIL